MSENARTATSTGHAHPAGIRPLREAWRASLGGLAAIVIFGAFVNLLKFAMPLYTLQVLDRIPASRSVETLVMLTAIAVPAVIAGVALYAVRRRMLTRWGAWLERRFGPQLLFSGLEGAGGAQAGAALQSLDDLSTLRSFITRSAAPWLDVMWAPVFVVAVYLIHPVLGTIQVIVLTTLICLGILQERMTREPRRGSSSASGDADSLMRSAESNRETVRALGMGAGVTDRWGKAVSTRLDERDRIDSRTTAFRALEQVLYRCLYVGGLGVGMWLAVSDSLSIGGVVAANIMMRFGFRLVARPARKWRALVSARRAYGRLAARFADDERTRTSVREADLRSALTFENVTHRYPGQADPVFRRIALTVLPGEILCVIGPSAAGKSTLSRLGTGVFVPRSGRVLLGDIDVSRLPSALQAQFIGYLPQDVRLFRGTVRDNIARLSDADFEDVVAAAKLAGIHETIVRLPKGYDTVIDEHAASLSGGERRRIALARAFFGQPHLIVLDEPEANLDRRSRKKLIKAVQHFKSRGSIVVMTTQTSRLGRIADKVLILGAKRAEMVSGDALDTSSLARLADARRTSRRPERTKSEDAQ